MRPPGQINKPHKIADPVVGGEPDAIAALPRIVIVAVPYTLLSVNEGTGEAIDRCDVLRLRDAGPAVSARSRPLPACWQVNEVEWLRGSDM